MCACFARVGVAAVPVVFGVLTVNTEEQAKEQAAKTEQQKPPENYGHDDDDEQRDEQRDEQLLRSPAAPVSVRHSAVAGRLRSPSFPRCCICAVEEK